MKRKNTFVSHLYLVQMPLFGRAPLREGRTCPLNMTDTKYSLAGKFLEKAYKLKRSLQDEINLSRMHKILSRHSLQGSQLQAGKRGAFAMISEPNIVVVVDGSIFFDSNLILNLVLLSSSLSEFKYVVEDCSSLFLFHQYFCWRHSPPSTS